MILSGSLRQLAIVLELVFELREALDNVLSLISFRLVFGFGNCFVYIVDGTGLPCQLQEITVKRNVQG